jgi:hypothetical protein
MNFSIILFLSAFVISGVAEFYSIAGLVSIFSSQAIASVIMGASLGIGKLVAASWVYRNWNTAPKVLKYYFTAAVVILSIITSMGIFGYLSKAHLDQSVVIGGSADKVRILDEKIKTSKENIEQSRKSIKQMDEAVDQTMARSTSEEGAGKASSLRRSQQTERKRIMADIETEQKRVSVLNEERLPLQAELTKIEAEVGPIKYVAELVYGSSNEEVIGKAVRLMIILIIFVFDPLAILLLIAANMEMIKHKTLPVVEEKKEEEEVPKVTMLAPIKPKKPKAPIKPKNPAKPAKPPKHAPKKPVKVPKKAEDDVVVIKRNSVYRFQP